MKHGSFLQARALVLPTMMSAVLLLVGCSKHEHLSAREVLLFSCQAHDCEILISQEDRFPENDNILFRVIRSGQVHSGPWFLGPNKGVGFVCLLDTDDMIAVAQASRPDQILVLFDIQTGELWPNRDNPTEAMKHRLQKKLNRVVGKKVELSEL